ncbi:MAG: hypothetical protein ACRC40_02425 [Fusobacteriaceae bacterium]
MEYMCINCGQEVRDKYEFEIHRYMCDSCYSFYISENPEEVEEY